MTGCRASVQPHTTSAPATASSNSPRVATRTSPKSARVAGLQVPAALHAQDREHAGVGAGEGIGGDHGHLAGAGGSDAGAVHDGRRRAVLGAEQARAGPGGPAGRGRGYPEDGDQLAGERHPQAVDQHGAEQPGLGPDRDPRWDRGARPAPRLPKASASASSGSSRSSRAARFAPLSTNTSAMPPRPGRDQVQAAGARRASCW
jgi:hypothetical protein